MSMTRCRRKTCQGDAEIGHGLRCGYCKKHCLCPKDQAGELLRMKDVADFSWE